MPNLPPPGTPLLTVSWDTVVGYHNSGTGGFDEPPEYEPVTIGSQVVDVLAHRLIDEVRRDVKTAVKEALAEQIRDQVAGIVTETLTGELRTTNAWGESIGEPTTLREMIAKQATEFLTAKATSDRYGNKVPGIAELLKTEVNDALTQELKATIVEARKQVAEAVKDRAGELLGGVINSTAPRR